MDQNTGSESFRGGETRSQKIGHCIRGGTDETSPQPLVDSFPLYPRHLTVVFHDQFTVHTSQDFQLRVGRDDDGDRKRDRGSLYNCQTTLGGLKGHRTPIPDLTSFNSIYNRLSETSQVSRNLGVKTKQNFPLLGTDPPRKSVLRHDVSPLRQTIWGV